MLVQRGQIGDAAKVYEQILEIAPYHVKALDFLATRAYEGGNTSLSLELLGRSFRAGPDRPIIYQNFGLVHKARGEYELALEALDRALQLQPVYPMALLHKGSILELLDRRREAVNAYYQAWQQAPGLRQSRYSEQVPTHTRELISHSADAISRARIGLLEKAFAILRSQQDPATFQRAEQFADLYLGRAQPKYKHAMQRPAFLYFPELRPQAFFEREDFSWVQELESSAPHIREELLVVLQHPDELQAYVQVPAPDPAQWKELNYSPKWSSFHLYKAAERNELHCQQCPVTTACIEKLPLVRTSGHSPEVFFSILKPGTHIPPHFGLANYKVAVHLPLIIPGDCAIRVGNETRTWTEGRCLIFDDSFQHEAWNNSSESRAVLILEVWNPQLSDAERQAVTATLEVIRDFEREYGSAPTVQA
ncbi:MAG: aspartyl/asparaginyl beta-hydroxylase domain-containing protein [Gammaproteobacteria bacterium]